LVALLVKLAYMLAIPLTALPAVVVEHLGIPEPVDLDELRNTVRKSSWRGMALNASCHHPAVLVALQEHAANVDAVVRSISAVANNDDSLRPLRTLPAVGASADKVVAATNSLGQPLFTTPVDRFRLDEERVRELLMDRNLYRDPALAIRELYQNALDACRLREARQRCRDKEEGTNLAGKATLGSCRRSMRPAADTTSNVGTPVSAWTRLTCGRVLPCGCPLRRQTRVPP
jgi:hypothetical protein